MTDDDSTSDTKKTGRPLKVDGPRFPQQEVDRILVFGELVDPGDGSGPTVVFPSYRELAQRYGVAHSVIAEYARKHNCIRRREQAQARVEARTDQKLIEMRATAIAMSKDDTLRIIDAYILGFEKAVADGRVRFENPSDFNTMVRLKQFIEGGADSRQEIRGALSLESLQARHKQMLQGAEAASAAERGDRERVPEARKSEAATESQPSVHATIGATSINNEGAPADDEVPDDDNEQLGNDHRPGDNDEPNGDEPRNNDTYGQLAAMSAARTSMTDDKPAADDMPDDEESGATAPDDTTPHDHELRADDGS